jgi:hypothetical protein
VDPKELAPAAASSFGKSGTMRRLGGVDLSELFGIAIEDVPLVEEPAPEPKKKRKKKSR